MGEHRASRFLVGASVAMLACLSNGPGCTPASILGASRG
jgi:hypothetical protein